MATIDKRSKKSWRARVRIPGFTLKTRSFRTRDEAEKWARLQEGSLRAGKGETLELSQEPTLAEALDRYLKERTPKKKGAEQERRRICAWMRWPEASRKLSELTSIHFSEHTEDRLEDGVAGNTIRADMSLISALYKCARKVWHLSYLNNPVTDVELPKPGDSRDRRLSEEETERFYSALAACDNPVVQQVVLFAIQTTARRSELLKLTWNNVNLTKRAVTFRDTKNGENRVAPLTQHATAILNQIRRKDDQNVFPLTISQLTTAWKEIRKAANITDFRFHDLRHEGTSQLFERGFTIMEAQTITGHKTLQMLLRYTHMDVAHLVDRLDATEKPGPDIPTPPAALAAPPPANVSAVPAPEIPFSARCNVITFPAGRRSTPRAAG